MGKTDWSWGGAAGGAAAGAQAGSFAGGPGMAIGGLLGGIGGGLWGGGPDPNALEGLRDINLSGMNMPGAEALFENIQKAGTALNPVFSAEMANLSRAIQAAESASRRGATSAGGTLGQRASAGGADALGGAATQIAGKRASAMTDLGREATTIEQQKVRQEISNMMAEVSSANQNLLARVGREDQIPSQWDQVLGAASSLGGTFSDLKATAEDAGFMEKYGTPMMENMLSSMSGGGQGASGLGQSDFMGMMDLLMQQQNPWGWPTEVGGPATYQERA